MQCIYHGHDSCWKCYFTPQETRQCVDNRSRAEKVREGCCLDHRDVWLAAVTNTWSWTRNLVDHLILIQQVCNLMFLSWGE